jgi:hypothetical protein
LEIHFWVLATVPTSTLGTFAKLWKVTISFIMSVHKNNSAPTGWIFMKFHIWGFFENLSRKFKFHENWTRIKGTLHEDQFTFLSYLAHFFLEWEMFQTKVVEKLETHVLCWVFFFLICAVYEIMLKNIVEHCRAWQATDNMVHVHCIPHT